jgi:hypothetical protein
MAKYPENSPWFKTEFSESQYLDVLSIRPVPAENDDILYEIEPQYTHRPDLLAYDLYGSQKLWWVFAQRNMNVILDPIYDFEAGVKIYLPKGQSIQALVG